MRFDELTPSTASPVGADIFPTVENVSTTHLHKSKTWTTIMNAIASYTQSLTNKTIGGGTAFIGIVDGWVNPNETWAYASATTITIPSGGLTKYAIGDRITWTASASQKYAYVVGVADTTLTVLGNAVTNVTLSSNYYSHDLTPVGFPQVFTWTPVITASAGSITSYTSSGYCFLNRKTIFVNFTFTITNAGTASGLYISTLPIASADAAVIVGREDILSGGVLLFGGTYGGASMDIGKYNNTFPGGTNCRCWLSGMYMI
jgi:hypothetical protein